MLAAAVGGTGRAPARRGGAGCEPRASPVPPTRPTPRREHRSAPDTESGARLRAGRSWSGRGPSFGRPAAAAGSVRRRIPRVDPGSSCCDAFAEVPRLNVGEAQTTRHQRLSERSGLRENSGDTRLVRQYRFLEEAQLGVEYSARQDSQLLTVGTTLGHNAYSAAVVVLRDARIGPILQMCPHRCPICDTFRR